MTKNACPYDAYIICTSPRSGSTLLCDLLTSTGICGQPRSYFHRPSLSAWLDAHNLPSIEGEPHLATLKRVFDAAIRSGRAGGKLFGLRLQQHSLEFFLDQMRVFDPDAESDAERIHAVFGRTAFIYLTRRDKIAQAVSYAKAEQTGLWHRAPDGREIERLAPHADPRYNATALRDQVRQFDEQDRRWRTWFETQAISPTLLTYQHLSSDPQGGLALCLEALGLDPSAALSIKPGVGKLADKTSEQWAVQLREDFPDLDEPQGAA